MELESGVPVRVVIRVFGHLILFLNAIIGACVTTMAQVRPLLEHEGVVSCEECVRVVGEDQLVLGGDRVFRFDRVFSPSAHQVC